MEAAPRVNGIVASTPMKPNASAIVQRNPPLHSTAVGPALSFAVNCSELCGRHCRTCEVIPCACASCARILTTVSICSCERLEARGSLSIMPRMVARSSAVLSCAPKIEGAATHMRRTAKRMPRMRREWVERSICRLYHPKISLLDDYRNDVDSDALGERGVIEAYARKRINGLRCDGSRYTTLAINRMRTCRCPRRKTRP